MINGVSQQPTMQKGMNLHIAGMSALNGIWKKGEISGFIGSCRKWTTIANSPCSGVIVYLRYE